MGRERRAIDPDGIYHATCRGSNRGVIVWDSYDCLSFCDELARVARRFEWQVYAWCLMDNHHHVLLRAEQEAFSCGFQQLNGNHSRRTNRRHGNSAHLFRNRPQAKAIESPAHLVSAIAYILRNPIEAGLVQHAGAWGWSSYRATMGREPAPPWLLVDEVLELFGRTKSTARRALAEHVHNGDVLVSDTGVAERAPAPPAMALVPVPA